MLLRRADCFGCCARRFHHPHANTNGYAGNSYTDTYADYSLAGNHAGAIADAKFSNSHLYVHAHRFTHGNSHRHINPFANAFCAADLYPYLAAFGYPHTAADRHRFAASAHRYGDFPSAPHIYTDGDAHHSPNPLIWPIFFPFSNPCFLRPGFRRMKPR